MCPKQRMARHVQHAHIICRIYIYLHKHSLAYTAMHWHLMKELMQNDMPKHIHQCSLNLYEIWFGWLFLWLLVIKDVRFWWICLLRFCSGGRDRDWMPDADMLLGEEGLVFTATFSTLSRCSSPTLYLKVGHPLIYDPLNLWSEHYFYSFISSYCCL